MAETDTAAEVVALIAASLRRERARAGLSLTEVARRAGIAKSTLSQLESGTGNPSVETLWALGVALDVYHIWWDPEIVMQIDRAGKDRLLTFHVCDWLVPTRDILNDRGMMGDGVIDIKSARAAVEAQGFAGYSEIEIFSNDWWNKPMDEVLRTCIARHKTVV